ncbi:hypothetical protein KSP39_PZI015175 [Platanthera zijinensis]|uniref:Nudix hydrolase domain-containing protein n=1 Tax=Platanthera zijinensis TaxID=2320716 RepID=A0AAP0BAB9_9ASPA
MTLPISRLAGGKLTTAFFPFVLPSPASDFLLIFAAALSFLIVVKNPFSTLPSSLRLRLRSTPSLSMRRTPPPPRPTLTFSSPESLYDWLKPRLPPGALSSWGTSPGTKTINNLWLELSQGETSLFLPSPSHDPLSEASSLAAVEEDENTPITPLRAVHVAILNIRNLRGALLVESHQLLSDGSMRQRGRPLSEKMRPGETVEEASIRAVEEELSSIAAASGSVRIVPGSYAVRVEEKASDSYPGLPARYVLHSVEAQVEGLPEEGEFSTDEVGETSEKLSIRSAIFVTKHFWKWVEDYPTISQ